jgi:hypothetical protein
MSSGWFLEYSAQTVDAGPSRSAAKEVSMIWGRLFPAALLMAGLCWTCSTDPTTSSGDGPLRPCPANPRYFCDSAGAPVFLAGSHTWPSVVDMLSEEETREFDFDAFLDWLGSYGHNFTRLWTWELTTWNTAGNREDKLHSVRPHPWLRTGPGEALDGKPRFDLTRFDPEYFDRLRRRAELARDRGFHVSVMLFEGWGLQFSPGAWESHPFHPANNINGIDADLDGDGYGLEVHTLESPGLAFQENYVRRVVEHLNDLDNVLYEIGNEIHPGSTDFQYHMIRLVKDNEAALPHRHPVGMTFQYRGGTNQALFDSPADWISPNPEGGYRDDPPAGNGGKVVLSDTDHLWGIGGNAGWVWKSFLRGLNPLFMDPYDGAVLGRPFDPEWEPIRVGLGRARRWAERIDLLRAVPSGELTSSGYCLADPSREYLVYLPEGGAVTVDLANAPGKTFLTEWYQPDEDRSESGETVAGGDAAMLASPFGTGRSLLHLTADRAGIGAR